MLISWAGYSECWAAVGGAWCQCYSQLYGVICIAPAGLDHVV